MLPSRYILAHDPGTTGNKATLFDATGTSAAVISKDYETAYPHPGWADQDAAIAGGIGVGLFPDFRAAYEIVQVQEAEQPNAEAQARYAELYPLFQETYRALEPIYRRLGKK